VPILGLGGCNIRLTAKAAIFLRIYEFLSGVKVGDAGGLSPPTSDCG